VRVALSGGSNKDHSGGANKDAQSEVTGSLTIGGFTGAHPCVGESYEGPLAAPHDFADIRGGTPVRVLDARGTVLGSSALSDGEVLKTGCNVAFQIPLDHTSSRYQLVIGTRPPYDFTTLDNLDLTLA